MEKQHFVRIHIWYTQNFPVNEILANEALFPEHGDTSSKSLLNSRG